MYDFMVGQYIKIIGDPNDCTDEFDGQTAQIVEVYDNDVMVKLVELNIPLYAYIWKHNAILVPN